MPTNPKVAGTDIRDLIRFEEGFREKPYRDTEGFPTIGYGFKIGPKGAALSNYEFVLPRRVADIWLVELVADEIAAMVRHPAIEPAWLSLGDDHARKAVLVSMCHQMGVEGLAKFKFTLGFIAQGKYDRAATQMLKSKWALQTPNRARRHAEQMKTGVWAKEYRP